MPDSSTYRRCLVCAYLCHLTSVDLELRSVVFDHLSNLLSLAERYSMLLIERTVVGLLRLCLIVAEKVIFHVSLSSLWRFKS
jgi:hypothetical protein